MTIAAIGEEFAEERIQTEQSRENQNPNIAILNVGGMNHSMKQEAYDIEEDVSLLAFDLVSLSKGCPHRSHSGRCSAPFFSPLTLRLSMMQAVGLASRSIGSRHYT
jgi:hypothetical protein